MLLSNPIQTIVSIATSATLTFAIAPNANAQRILSPSQTQQVINGLSYPTSSQRFFEAGQRNFEREIDDLEEGEFLPPKSILQIDEKLLQQGKISPRDRFIEHIEKQGYSFKQIQHAPLFTVISYQWYN
jgi:hypothetical protein